MKLECSRSHRFLLQLLLLVSLQSALAASLATLPFQEPDCPSLASSLTMSSPSKNLPSKMRCIIYGGSKRGLQIVTRPTPVVSRTGNTVLVKVHCAGLNPVDAKDVMGDKLPHSWTRARGLVQSYIANKIPGFDFSGTVVDTSSEQSEHQSSFQPGDKVFGCMPPLQGSLAEYICVPTDQICYMPRNYTFAQAAALPLVGLTALQALTGHVDQNSSVLIIGASGGTGHVALQVAAQCLGAAHVTAVCSARNAAFCRALGATHVVDYARGAVASDLKAAPGCPYTVVLDCVTSADPVDSAMQYPAMIQDPANGLVLQADDFVYRRLGGASSDWIRAGLERTCGLNCWKNKHEKLFWIRFPKSSHELRQLQEWAESGKLTPTVSNVYDFSVSGVRAAFDEILSRRAVGKVVVRVLAEEDAGAEQELSKKM
jgi:NADPH:quinone reductase-like Zn-dependent oxidoreductase